MISTRLRRWVRAAAMLAACALLPATAALAERPPVTATLDGSALTLTPPARTIAGRIYLPLRPLAQALGIPVHAVRQQVEMRLSDRTIDFTVGAAEVYTGGGTVAIGAPIVQVDGTIFVPLRFVSSALGAQVTYDPITRHLTMVSIFAGAAQAPPTAGASGAAARVSGTVTAVDRNSEPPTVTVMQDDLPRTISMTSQAQIVLQDVSVHTTVAGTLADIQPGDELAATIDPSGAVVQVVDFFASHSGRIAAVSGSTFVLKDGRVVTPPSSSVVTLNGVRARVADLRVGDRVTLRSNPQTNEVKAVIASRPSTGTPPPAGAVRITAFSFAPTTPLRAGETLDVSMAGTPGGAATFDLGPIVKGLPMTEVSPGHYHGSLPITDGMNLTDISVFGILAVNGVAAPRAEAPAQLSVATTPPQIGDIAPLAGERINNDRPNIFATFSSPTQLGIDPGSIRLVVNGQDVTALAMRNPDFIVYSPQQAMAPGSVNVSVSVADLAGNVVSRSWSFTIGRGQ